jgi:hypothetical protein
MRLLIGSLLYAAFLSLCGPALALPIWWGADASGELSGGRNALAGGGVTALGTWTGGFSIGWEVVNNPNGTWSYTYTLAVPSPGVSHYTLEVTLDGDGFTAFPGSSPLSSEGARWWSPDDPGNSNPNLPNALYGIKFDFGSENPTYTVVTNRLPVYGVFYAKGGSGKNANSGEAWSDALTFSDYQTNEFLSADDFIVRPDGDPPISNNPIPGPALLLGSGLAGLAWLRKRRKG